MAFISVLRVKPSLGALQFKLNELIAIKILLRPEC
jgi:hypothetical protein